MNDPRANMAAELRRDFDGSFARAPHGAVAKLEDLLAIRVGGDPFALCVAEVVGLSAGREVTPLPTAVPALLGLASVRGVLVPVYDLRLLLGYPAAANDAVRPLALVGPRAPIGLAFDDLGGYLRVPPEAITSHEGSSGLVRGVAQTNDGPRPVLHLSSVIDAITKRARLGVQREEK